MFPFLMYPNDDSGLLQFCQFNVDPAGRVKVNLKDVTIIQYDTVLRK